jgi:hypothetical protein
MAPDQLQSNEPNRIELVEVVIESPMGSRYTFPSVDKHELEKILPRLSNRVPIGQPSLCLINAQFAALAIPYRLIKSVKVNGEEWWTAP